MLSISLWVFLIVVVPAADMYRSFLSFFRLFLQLLAEPFSVDNGLLTPKLSTKRKAIVDRYKDVLEALYDDEPHLHDTRGAERD